MIQNGVQYSYSWMNLEMTFQLCNLRLEDDLGYSVPDVFFSHRNLVQLFQGNISSFHNEKDNNYYFLQIN
jgi:hypothetical protein